MNTTHLKGSRLNIVKKNGTQGFFTISNLQYILYALLLLAQLIITFYQRSVPDLYTHSYVWGPFYLISFILTAVILFKNIQPLLKQEKCMSQSFIFYGTLGIFVLFSFLLMYLNLNNVIYLPLLAFMVFDLLNCVILKTGDAISLIITGVMAILMGVTLYFNIYQAGMDTMGLMSVLGPLLYILQSLFFEKKEKKESSILNLGVGIFMVASVLLLSVLLLKNEIDRFEILQYQPIP